MKIKFKNSIKKSLLGVSLVFTGLINAQVGIGTNTPDASAALEVRSTTKGLLLPRLTSSQISAISNPAEGLIVYCTDCARKGVYVFNGTNFISVIDNAPVNGFGQVTGAGGAIWADRNLGASQIAVSLTDANAYGDLYQWGRNTDGHQSRSSGIATGPVASGSEGSNFIISNSDWLSSSDDTRWNGSAKGIHDPCPNGFRVPTEAEWTTETNAWSTQNAAGAFASSLKISLGGFRLARSGSLSGVGSRGDYHSSTISSSGGARVIDIDSGTVRVVSTFKASASSIRCIKE